MMKPRRRNPNATSRTDELKCSSCLWLVQWEWKRRRKQMFICADTGEYMDHYDGICDHYVNRQQREREYDAD